MILLFPHPLPVSHQQVVSLSLPVCRRSSFLTEAGGRGWGRSQIIRRRENLVLFKSFNILSGYSAHLSLIYPHFLAMANTTCRGDFHEGKGETARRGGGRRLLSVYVYTCGSFSIALSLSSSYDQIPIIYTTKQCFFQWAMETPSSFIIQSSSLRMGRLHACIAPC
jgi:hypothetical protein